MRTGSAAKAGAAQSPIMTTNAAERRRGKSVSEGSSEPINPAIPAIHLESVHLTLASEAGRVNILQDIHLHIDVGETVSLVGPSGSGKTSLLLLIAGLEQASAGRIALSGRDITRMSEDDLALLRRDQVGIVFQSFHLIPTMSALENVAVPLELSGSSDAFQRAEAALTAVGLAHRLTHYPSQLSGGEQQRVALARALAPRPKILLADEPTGNLDLRDRRQDRRSDVRARARHRRDVAAHHPRPVLGRPLPPPAPHGRRPHHPRQRQGRGVMAMRAAVSSRSQMIRPSPLAGEGCAGLANAVSLAGAG